MMMASDWVKLVISILACQLAGVLGSFATVRSIPTWYATLQKPSFNPPNWIFGPVWITLYLMMGIAVFFIWRIGLTDPRVRLALLVFLIQLALNAIWSPVFFGLHSVAGGMVVIVLLWLGIVATLALFIRIDWLPGVLLIPYLLWVTFAAILNGALLYLNRSSGV